MARPGCYLNYLFISNKCAIIDLKWWMKREKKRSQTSSSWPNIGACLNVEYWYKCVNFSFACLSACIESELDYASWERKNMFLDRQFRNKAFRNNWHAKLDDASASGLDYVWLISSHVLWSTVCLSWRLFRYDSSRMDEMYNNSSILFIQSVSECFSQLPAMCWNFFYCAICQKSSWIIDQTSFFSDKKTDCI